MSRAVGVIVLNWNGWRDTLACLDSLAAADPRPARVVVVDNGSTDDSIARLRRWEAGSGTRGRVRLVTLAGNRGFAGGNNAGLAALARDPSITHFLLLNNDATVAADYFAELMSALDQVPNAAVLSGTVYYAADPAHAWYAGGGILGWRATARHGEVVPSDGRPRPTTFVSGCAMVISRGAYERLGGLAECYRPMYWEDAEYSLRAQRGGLPVTYAPRAVAYHKVTASASTLPRRIEYLRAWHKNRGWFVRRNLGGPTRLSALAYLALVKTLHGIVRGLGGKPREGWAMVRGTWAGLVGPIANG